MKDDAELPFDSVKAKNRLSEVRVAEMFVEQHGDDFRYVSKWKMWMVWDGKRWREEGTRLVGDLIKRICTQYARGTRSNAEVRGMLKNSFITGAEAIASRDRQVAATTDQWDSDNWLLCTPGGVVDLRTGQMREHRRDDYITKMTGATPDAGCPTPTWDAHLQKTFGGDQELIDYWYRVLGYCLTGDTGEDALFFCYGEGGCAKTTTIELVLRVFGDYGEEAPMGMFVESRSGHGHPTELTVLRGRRLITASEHERGSRFSQARLKKLTGGGRFQARGMRQDFYVILPTHKLMFEGEQRPQLTTVDAGSKRRLNIIPFKNKISDKEKDPGIDGKLDEEAPGILAKMIVGCLEWQRDGLRPAAAVSEATTDYLNQQDQMKDWFEECVDVEPGGTGAFSSALYASYRRFMELRGEQPSDEKTFIAELESRAGDFKIERVIGTFKIGERKGRGFKGIKTVRPAKANDFPF